MAIDVKTITSADPGTCSRHAYNFGYDIQCAAYTEAITAIKPEWAGRLEFIFLFCELEPPYAVVPRRPDNAMLELGRRRWQRAKEVWKDCLARGAWPGYADDIDTLYLPGWAVAQLEEAE